MVLVSALAALTICSIGSLPWLLHRRGDAFEWRAIYLEGYASVWWAMVNIVSFAIVYIAGALYGVPGAAVAGALVSGAFAWTFQSRFASSRRLQALCAALSDGGAKAVEDLEAELARYRERTQVRSNGYVSWARWTLHAAGRASMAGYAAEALRWTEDIDPNRVGPRLRSVYVQHAATIRVTLGDRAGARALIAGAARPAAPAAFEEGLQGLEALLEAFEGDAAKALARADAALASGQSPVRQAWAAVRAHALEASGASREARAMLLSMRSEFGDDALRRVVRHAGPASAQAAAMLTNDGPYR